MAKIFQSIEEAQEYYRGKTIRIIGQRGRQSGRKNEFEHELQVRCVEWFDANYPEVILFAIPNGGQRHKATAGKLKAEGVRAGVPDLFLAEPGDVYGIGCLETTVIGQFNGLFIEMKVKPNRPTKAQAEMLKKLTAAGYMTRVIYSFEEFQEEVEAYLNQSK